MQKGQRGFTLIELLVVIAIIGLLSSVIIASLNSARSKGSDASIKSNFNSTRTQAELYYDDHSMSYASMCTADRTISAALTSAAAVTGSSIDTTLTNAQTSTKLSCHIAANGGAYAISAPLKANSGHYWCIDSTGRSTDTTSLLGTSATVCP